MSLRWRLTLLFLAATLLVWAPVNLWIYTNALRDVNQIYDAHLARSARVLLSLAAASAERGELDELKHLIPTLIPTYLPQLQGIGEVAEPGPKGNERLMAFQLLGRDGSVLLASASAPSRPLAAGIPGFSDSRVSGVRWRVFGVADPKQGLVLYAGEPQALRATVAWDLVESLLVPTFLAVPVLLALTWTAASSGLRPLVVLVREVKQRAPQDLRPLSGVPVPPEVQPLVSALNDLLRRLGRALDRERQFTGNAAHELRTPLAALRVQAQVAQRAATEEQRHRALDQIIAGVGHAGHLVDQLLTLSRLDNRVVGQTERGVRLLEVARRTAADLEPLARDRSVSVQIEGADNAATCGDETCISILFRNLLDNAIRYGPLSGDVTLTVRDSGLFNRIVVTDQGPGLPDGQHAEMFERFRRGSAVKAPGSGLGLSIVRRICELHGGSVHLENRPEGGLRCEVRLPLIATASPDLSPPGSAHRS